jgi:gliding motility-associated-like protein
MKYFFNLLLLFISPLIFAQNDCSDALIICGNEGYTNLKASGIGIQEVSLLNSCSGRENNSIWMNLIIKKGGTFGFTLTPRSSSIQEDFDFFIFGPNASCGNLGQAIRCSTTNPEMASQGNNLTGMNITETDVAEGPGPDGNSFVKWMDVQDGESYFLVIDLPIGTSNFDISWTGTASFADQPTFENPTANALDLETCENDSITDGSYLFDLTANDAVAIGSQTDVEVSYYTSSSDAITGNNRILTPKTFRNFTNPQTIFMRITNTNTLCYDTTEFDLSVSNAGQLLPANNISTCDQNDTGFYTFDLSQNDFVNPDPVNYTLSYFNDETDALDGINPIPLSYTNKKAYTSEFIWIRVEDNTTGCYSMGRFLIEVIRKPTVKAFFTLKQCDEDGLLDGITDFNLNEVNEYITFGDDDLIVTYYLTLNHAENNINPIAAFPFSNGSQIQVFARIENAGGCYSTSQIDLLVSSTKFDPNYLKSTVLCDEDDTNDGMFTFDLSENDREIADQFPGGQNLTVAYYRSLVEAQLEENEISKHSFYINESPFNQTLFVRVESSDNGECFGIGPHLVLKVLPRPEFELDETGVYCQNLDPIEISILNPEDVYSYEWLDAQNNVISMDTSAIVSKEGTYTVTAVSPDGCISFPRSIIIEPSVIASITENDITIVDDSQNNSLSIATGGLGIGDYEFALDDDFSYQDEPHFENLEAGIHRLFIRDKKNCGTTYMDVAIIGFPQFFTPNNDGYNDTWKVLGVNENFYAASTIFIYDRYGKFITQVDTRGTGWNGTFNGEVLPSSDYWFTAELVDASGVSRFRKGHFSLIRK